MKKHLFRNCAISLMFLFLLVNAAFAQTETKVSGGIATLYALDPFASSLCFDDGREGGVIQQYEMRNRCSHINFNSYNKEGLTVGVEGGQNGTIVDLGNSAELQKRYGYSETVGDGQGFASLRSENGKVFILKNKERGSQTHSEQELMEAPLVFAESKVNGSAPVKLGHIYLLRINDRNDKTFERIVKLIVVSYAPGESVTIRWQTM